jgi:hypothetical protein
MSEYQYYDFYAVDRPLNNHEMAELRKLSTRAEITPTRFSNTYNWGDFGGSPKKMMEKYFDAHVYVANWGSFHLMLRLPKGVIDEELLESYIFEDTLTYWTTDKHVIIFWHHDSEDGWFELVKGEGWLNRLLPIRDELEKGDYRSLYLGWLLGVHLEYTHEESIEPPLISRDKKLTRAQKTLVDFLSIDIDLVNATMLGIKSTGHAVDQEKYMQLLFDQMNESEAKKLLMQVMRGESLEVRSELRRQYNQLLREAGATHLQDEASRRKVRELVKHVEVVRQQRLAREDAEEERKRAEDERKRREYLDTLVQKFPEIWDQVEALAQRQLGITYDKARDLLVDLSDAYTQAGRSDEFSDILKNFTERHSRRQALLQRLKYAGLM